MVSQDSGAMVACRGLGLPAAPWWQHVTSAMLHDHDALWHWGQQRVSYTWLLLAAGPVAHDVRHQGHNCTPVVLFDCLLLLCALCMACVQASGVPFPGAGGHML